MNKKKHFSPVSWNTEGEPYSAQFDDIYHTTSGVLEQAQQIFLLGTNLPQRWANSATQVILETGFGLGLNFLATWQQWQADPNRCDRLHFVSLELFPVSAPDIIKAVQAIPSLQPLAQKMANHYPVTMPGIYRLVFEEENFQQVILTLAFGQAHQLLPQLQLQADSIFLDGFSPAKNPELWEERIFKAIAKISAPNAHIATWSVAGHVRRGLQAAGFDVEKTPGLPPKRESLKGLFKPYLKPKQLSRKKTNTQAGITHPEKDAKDAIVIGAGIAGASVCYSLAQRGWQLKLIDQYSGPAQGASGLPMGLALPYISADDALPSQLTRSGIAWLKHLISAIKLSSKFWQKTALEKLITKSSAQNLQNNPLFDYGLTNENQPCMRFHEAYQIEAPHFVQALLRHTPGLQYLWNTQIKQLKHENGRWLLFNADGKLCAESPHVIVCSALDTLRLCGMDNKGITPNRGQITLGIMHKHDKNALPQARTGHGHFVLPLRQDAGWSWSMGSTFDAGSTDREIRTESHQENYAKLQHLSPAAAKALKNEFEQGLLSSFIEIRCTSNDHLPLLGAAPDIKTLAQQNANQLHIENAPVLPGLFMLTALGSRGLTVGPWCAEILASMICREPWPVTTQMARSLIPARFEVKTRRQY